MQRINDLFKELGFNPNGSEEVQKAFIKHLVRVADVSQKNREIQKMSPTDGQLSFDFDYAVGETPPTQKKSA